MKKLWLLLIPLGAMITWAALAHHMHAPQDSHVSFLSIPVTLITPEGTPDLATIHKLEADIKPGAIRSFDEGQVPVVTDYARFYATVMRSDKHIILGEWVMPEIMSDRQPGIYPVATYKQFPRIMDGGCGIVEIEYDLATNSILKLKCHGNG